MPEFSTLFVAGSYSAANYFPMPNNISQAATAARKVTLETTVGTTLGFLIAQPHYAGFQDANDLFTTSSAYAGTGWPSSGAAGVITDGLDLTTGYECDGKTYGWTAYARLTLKANSAALTAKSGRLIFGANWNEVSSGMTPTQLAQLRTTTTFALDQVNQASMPMTAYVPMLHCSSPSAPPSTTTTFPGIFVCIDGAATGTTFEFEFEYVAVMAGANRPWKQPVEFDTDAIAPAVTSMQATADKGFSHPVMKEPKKALQHHEHLAAKEIKKQPLLSRIVDYGKDLLSKTKLGGLLRRAIGFASKLF
jgi:hypothetical protein